jgi:hypothetical protein
MLGRRGALGFEMDDDDCYVRHDGGEEYHCRNQVNDTTAP